MKKTDLRRSIDGIKQDKELKEQILKAVQEKDKVTVIKRPLFVPMLAICLLCLNVGMIAKLIIFNKSQVNISELKARTQLSSVSDYDESLTDEEIMAEKERKERDREEELRKEQESIESDIEKVKEDLEEQKKLAAIEEDLKDPVRVAKEMNFQVEKEMLEEKLNKGELTWFEEWRIPKDYDLQKTLPCYMSGNALSGYNISVLDSTESDWDYTCVRYVEYNNYISNGNKGNECIYFNHEYLVVYNGETSDPKNIVSITESDVAPQECSLEYLTETAAMLNSWYKFEEKNTIFDIYNKLGGDDIDPTTKNLSGYGYNALAFVLYPKTAGGSLERVQAVCFSWDKSSEDMDDVDISDRDNVDIVQYNEVFLVDENMNEVSEKYRDSIDGYWKETVYTGYDIDVAEKAVVPDVLGMDREEAENVLREAGFTTFSTYFVAANDIYEKPGQIHGCYPPAGTTVYKGVGLDLSICGHMVPFVIGYSAEDAVKMIENCGYTAKLEYDDGVDPNEPDLIVVNCSPNTQEALKTGSEVTLTLANPTFNTDANMIGKAISLRWVHVYSAEETAKRIANREQPEQTQMLLSDYHYYPTTGIVTGRQYDDFFVVESLTVEKGGEGNLEILPYLSLGMPLDNNIEGLQRFIEDNPFYKNRDAAFYSTDYEDYDLLLYYKNKSGTEMYAYIKLEDSTEVPGMKEISRMCISEHKLT